MQNPAFLQPMIQQIAQANPGLAEHLAQNPEALLQLLGTLGGDGAFDDGEGEGGEGGSSSGGQVLQVTPEERAAIERVRTLCMLPSSVMLMLFSIGDRLRVRYRCLREELDTKDRLEGLLACCIATQ